MILSHKRRFLVLGLFIFGNQAAFVAGLKLAGGVASAVWQPTQPIMTACICMVCGWETYNIRRVLGVGVAFVGCACMVLWSVVQAQKEDATATDSTFTNTNQHQLAGHLLLFVNCLSTSLYVIASKRLLRLGLAPLVVTAWSNSVAAVFMALCTWLVAQSDTLMMLACPDCTGSTWHIPPGAWFALFYFILFNTCGAHAIMTWANQYATGTLVMGYTVLQPVTAALLTGLLLSIKLVPSCTDSSAVNHTTTTTASCLDPPGWGTVIGMVGVFGGLCLVITTEPKQRSEATTVYERVERGEQPHKRIA